MAAVQRDLGKESIGKLMFSLAMPAVISQLVNMLYNMVDRMYIGHIAGEGRLALTGLGLCFPVIMIVSAFSALFGMGGAPNAAIEMGRKNNDRAEKILGNSVTCLLMISLILTFLLMIFGKRLLFMFGASDNTIGYAWDYLKIYVMGTVFVQMALGLNMYITTQGFALYAMATVMLGAILNIVLDPILIFGLNMGVKGAAMATIISQCVSSIWVLAFLSGKKTKLRIKLTNMKLDKTIVTAIVALGMSPFIMQSTESILNICFNSSLSRYGGDLAVGAMTIIASIFQLVFMPIQGFSQGAQPIISYNYGAGNIDRVKKAFRLLITICVCFTVTVFLVMQLFPTVFISIFNDDLQLVEITTWCMRVYTAGVFMMGLQTGCQQTFVALGQAKISLFLACLRKLILLIPLIYILPNFFENKVFAVFLAEPVADIMAALTTFTLFIITTKKLLDK